MSNSQTTITFFLSRCVGIAVAILRMLLFQLLSKNFFDVKETVIRENFFVQIGCCCNYFKGLWGFFFVLKLKSYIIFAALRCNLCLSDWLIGFFF